jgi:hypothetical protein
VEEIVDTDSFVSTYLVEELFHDVDVDLSSFYFHRGSDGKLRSGPVWDFDLCAGNYNTVSSNDPGRLYAAERSSWYSSLLGYGEFRAMVSERLAETFDEIGRTLDGCLRFADEHRSDFLRNYERWDILGKHTAMNPPALMALDSWQEQVDFASSWLHRSLDTMAREYL